MFTRFEPVARAGDRAGQFQRRAAGDHGGDARADRWLPQTTLNRSVPVVTESVLPLFERRERQSISTAPSPALAKLLLPLLVKPPAKVAVVLTVLKCRPRCS